MTDSTAVSIMLTAIYESLDSLKNSHPEIYKDEKFFKWALMASINLTCRFAKVGKLDVETLLKNVQNTMELIEKPKTNIIN
jgi:hypothetical protein